MFFSITLYSFFVQGSSIPVTFEEVFTAET